MNITVNIYYSGKNGAAFDFVQEMIRVELLKQRGRMFHIIIMQMVETLLEHKDIILLQAQAIM